jgi:uncharacterized protein (DUF1800 family)
MTANLTRFRSLAREAAQATLIATLCATTAAPEAFAADVPHATHTAPLTHSEKTLHALNRLTFGPRPGDEQTVDKMGLEAWFQRQLHPETIDDSALDKRLDEFPAMKLSITELMERFPSQLRLRLALARGGDVPTGEPVEHAIYADSMARYRAGLELKAGGTFGDAADGKAMDAAMATSAAPEKAASADMADGAAANRRPQKANGLIVDANDRLPVSTLTAEQVREIVGVEPDARFQQIVALNPSDFLKFSRMTASRPQDVMRGFTPEQREAFAAMESPTRIVATEVLGERILRDTYSERQLQAVMTDFWLNHFSVYVKKDAYAPYMLNSYERDTVLPNSLGNFEQLLIATAESPAMMMYLDNWQSVGPDSSSAQRVDRATKATRANPKLQKFLDKAPKGINENYARELMELHTVGVNGGYTQKDVIEVAKCFTGWTVKNPYGAGGPYAKKEGSQETFLFDASRHEPGPKVVMGVTIPESGMQEGLTVLHMLATSPNTAQFVSQKLAVRFISDNPPKSLVDAMAATFLKTHGDIKSVMTTMFHSPEFWSPKVYRAKVKTPIEFMVSALRASDASIQSPVLLIQAMERLGMPVYGMQTPNGYSWKSEDWVSSGALVNRMNFALVLSGDHVRGASLNWQNLLGDSGSSSIRTSPTAATEKQLEALILGELASPKTRATVLDQFKNDGIQQAAAKNFALSEASSPDGSGMEAASNGRKSREQLFIAYKKKGSDDSGGFAFDSKQPETPLGTMAGLLLGSPDFQRR